MSNSMTRLTKNSLWMIFSRFAAQGLAVVFTVLLARRLGIDGFGSFAFIAAVIFIATALTTFGTDMLLVREIAANDSLSSLPAALVIQLAFSLVIIAGLWVFRTPVPNLNQEAFFALKIYSLALLPLALYSTCTAALRGRQLMDAYALLNISVSALQVGAVLLLSDIDIVSLASALVIVHATTALLSGLLCTQAIPGFWHTWRLSLTPLLDFLKATVPFALLATLTIVYQRLSILMLSLIGDPVQTGLFSAAARVVEASKTAHLAVFTALYPVMANAASLPGEGLEDSPPMIAGGSRANVLSTYPGYLVAGAVLISLLLFVLARPLVGLFYGSEYSSSIAVLRILAWSVVPFTVHTYLVLSFLATNREAPVGIALGASLLGMLVLNMWWIPARGPVGSAWAVLAAESLQASILVAWAPARIFGKGGPSELSEFS